MENKNAPTKRYTLRDHTITKTNMFKALNPEAEEFIPGAGGFSSASSPERVSSPEKMSSPEKKKKGKKSRNQRYYAKRNERQAQRKERMVRGTETGSPVLVKKESEEDEEDEEGAQVDSAGAYDLFVEHGEREAGEPFLLTPQRTRPWTDLSPSQWPSLDVSDNGADVGSGEPFSLTPQRPQPWTDLSPSQWPSLEAIDSGDAAGNGPRSFQDEGLFAGHYTTSVPAPEADALTRANRVALLSQQQGVQIPNLDDFPVRLNRERMASRNAAIIANPTLRAHAGIVYSSRPYQQARQQAPQQQHNAFRDVNFVQAAQNTGGRRHTFNIEPHMARPATGDGETYDHIYVSPNSQPAQPARALTGNSPVQYTDPSPLQQSAHQQQNAQGQQPARLNPDNYPIPRDTGFTSLDIRARGVLRQHIRAQYLEGLSLNPSPHATTTASRSNNDHSNPNSSIPHEPYTRRDAARDVFARLLSRRATMPAHRWVALDVLAFVAWGEYFAEMEEGALEVEINLAALMGGWAREELLGELVGLVGGGLGGVMWKA